MTTRTCDHAARLPGGPDRAGERPCRERIVPFDDGRPRRGACGAVSGIGGTRYPRTSPTVQIRSVNPAAMAGVRSRHVRAQATCRRWSAAWASHPLSALPTSYIPASTVVRERAGDRFRRTTAARRARVVAFNRAIEAVCRVAPPRVAARRATMASSVVSFHIRCAGSTLTSRP